GALEWTADRGADSKHREIVGGDLKQPYAPRTLTGPDVGAGFVVGVDGRDIGERLHAAAILSIVGRRAVAVLAPFTHVLIEPNELTRLGIRQGREEHGVDRAEHRRRAANADGQRQYGDEREARTPAQGPE